MKKDIKIPEVKKVVVACVPEFNPEFRTRDWNVYLINNNDFPLETVLIVSMGYSGKKETSTMRHTLKVLPAKSFAKIEFLTEEVIKLKNEFSISFFTDSGMLHKNFLFMENSINEKFVRDIPGMVKKGILSE